MGEVMEERRIYQEAEWNVLGALIVDADYCAAEILLEVSPADFIHTECREIFKAAAALYAGDIPISRLSLAAKLPGEYADMLTQLEQITPTATLFRASVAALKREARRNRAFTAAQEIADKLRYGEDGYDAGAKILTDFFAKELDKFYTDDLDPLGKEIIDCFRRGGTIEDYCKITPMHF